MRGVLLEKGGGVSLRDDLPEPEPQDGQRVLETRAAAINFMEVLIRRGRYPQMPELPWLGGAEVAGELDGRAWIALVRGNGGGWAERVAVDEQWLFPLPEGAGWAEGASFLMTFLTAWLPLTRQASIRHGSRVLVTAAAGGVGSAAVQVAKVLGAHVVAAVGSEEKKELPRSLGASEVVTYEELGEVAPVDVAFDVVGGELFATCLLGLRPLGVVLAIGYAGGPWHAVEPQRLVGRNVGVQGFYLGRLMQLDPGLVREATRDVLRLWEGGSVRPAVGGRFALDDAGAALDLVESRRSTGKVVLIP